ncbi:hypothetical protein B0H14DRAFT_2563909 [Mycena olivaceomarginata]|nr:hypothetical protein B0H14DRAFT_2563909 [Mycena olivaceomarginata]
MSSLLPGGSSPSKGFKPTRMGMSTLIFGGAAASQTQQGSISVPVSPIYNYFNGPQFLWPIVVTCLGPVSSIPPGRTTGSSMLSSNCTCAELAELAMIRYMSSSDRRIDMRRNHCRIDIADTRCKLSELVENSGQFARITIRNRKDWRGQNRCELWPVRENRHQKQKRLAKAVNRSQGAKKELAELAMIRDTSSSPDRHKTELLRDRHDTPAGGQPSAGALLLTLAVGP